MLGLANATSLTSDGSGYCAVLRDGEAECWGDNQDGVLGAASHVAYSSVPVTVKNLSGTVAITSDGSGYCAVLRDGGVKCWGADASGSLGTGDERPSSDIPVPVRGVSGVVSVLGDGGIGLGYCAGRGTGEGSAGGTIPVACWEMVRRMATRM